MRATPIKAGDRFGDVVVVRVTPRPCSIGWFCARCGAEGSCRSRQVRSIHCPHRTRSRVATLTHGLSNTPEHNTWRALQARCLSPTATSYKYYGGRGIRVCEDWIGPGGFERFLAHVGTRPTPDHSIDRIDNDGHYEPGNVRWALSATQLANRPESSLRNFRAGRARMHRQRRIRRVIRTWERYGTLYSYGDEAALSIEIDSALVGELGRRRAMSEREAAALSMEEFYFDTDAHMNDHTVGLDDVFRAEVAAAYERTVPWRAKSSFNRWTDRKAA
jgi:hypothetical protein